MRDFRDAKAMAHTIRAALAANGTKITVSQSLELIAKAFGVADWNTLSAAISADPPAPRQSPSAVRPSITENPLPPERVSGFSLHLTATLQQAITSAKQRSHEHATPEHLLLALLDDSDASVVIRACNVDLDLLRRELSGFLDNEPKHETREEVKPTAAFERVVQRAVLHVRASGRQVVTSANVLVALFSERESRAVQALKEQGMTRLSAVNYIAHGTVKRDGDAAA